MACPTIRQVAATLLLVVSPLAWPQAHEKAFGDYVLRSSVVSSESVPDVGVATHHGIERGPDVAILNVSVLRKGQPVQTVPARVEAVAVNLAGIRRKVDMKETRSGEWVSYSGTFKFAPREVFDFTIRAEPAGSGTQLEMTYRERLWKER